MALKLDTTKAIDVITEEEVAMWRRVIARLDADVPPIPPPVAPPPPPPDEEPT